MPNDELMIVIGQIAFWLEWYDYVKEASSYHDATCPQEVKDEPNKFNNWLRMQKQKEESKTRSKR